MEQKIVRTTHAPAETQGLARALGEACQGGELFLIVGSLGAGKTCFTQGLASGLGVDEYVHSPTFVLAARYQGRLTLHHLDLYRLDAVAEVRDLGIDELIDVEGVCAVEWADKAMEVFPEDRMTVELEDLGGDNRRIVLRASGARHQRLLERLPSSATAPER